MDLPAGLRKKVFRRNLRQGTVFRLKGDLPFESDCYHVFVVLNYDPDSGEILFLVNGTSKVEKRLGFLEKVQHLDARSTTVILQAGSYRFTTQDTLFDCNTVHVVNIENLDFQSDNVKEILSDQLSAEDIEKIIASTLASPMVSPHIKAQIKP